MLVSSTNRSLSAKRSLFAQSEVRVHASVTEIERADWQRLLPGEAENWDYYRVVEMAPPPHFRLGAISVRSGGELIAVAPDLPRRLPASTRRFREPCARSGNGCSTMSRGSSAFP